MRLWYGRLYLSYLLCLLCLLCVFGNAIGILIPSENANVVAVRLSMILDVNVNVNLNESGDEDGDVTVSSVVRRRWAVVVQAVVVEAVVGLGGC